LRKFWVKVGVPGSNEYAGGVGSGDAMGGVLVGGIVGDGVNVGPTVAVQFAGKVVSGVKVGCIGVAIGRSVGGGKGLNGSAGLK
jgi:hypothetical protein